MLIMKKSIFVLAIFLTTISFSQETSKNKLPYYEVPEYPKEFTAGTVAARMVDGLGFRFYWATDSLTQKDLAYKSSPEGRTSEETIRHIYNLSQVIVNSTLKQPNSRANESLSYVELRAKTLNNLKTAADILRESDDISQYKIIFGERELPFWNQLNGPIADALWHCGQIVSFRRASGNPINPKVSFLNGKVRD